MTPLRVLAVLTTVLVLPSKVFVQDPAGGGRAATQAGAPVVVAGPVGGGQERPVVAQFDADKNGRLDATERLAAREFLATAGNRGARFGRGGNRPPPAPGVRLSSSDVRHYPTAPLYDPATLRTFFIEFAFPEWEAEMAAFNNTDVEVPATVTVDGKVYRDVGVHFRGNSSFGVGDGYKRSLNLTFDWIREDQSVGGYRTLNFLNANADPTLLRTVLSMHVARQYIAAPKANVVRVVINGENWGVYTNAQQFNKDFLRDYFKTEGGTRWKVPQGGGNGIGGFRYVDDRVESYRNVFQIKSKDQPSAWSALVDLARTLRDTPADQLARALEPRLDIDSYLRFLALDNAMVSGDGFYARAADYSLYLHPNGRFYFTFHDANEMFSQAGALARGGGSTGGVSLDPLATHNDVSKPIISKVLAVPALRAKYIGFVREIAENGLDWTRLGPVVQQYRDLIADDVARDTRKLYSTEEFLRSTAHDGTLRTFIDQRRAFLLDWTAKHAKEAQP